MSFSFQVRAATKALALAAVSAEMAEIVAAQPVHTHDADAVQKVAEHYASLLPEAEDNDVAIACNGYLSWDGTDAAPEFTSANVGVNVRFLARE